MDELQSISADIYIKYKGSTKTELWLRKRAITLEKGGKTKGTTNYGQQVTKIANQWVYEPQ